MHGPQKKPSKIRLIVATLFVVLLGCAEEDDFPDSQTQSNLQVASPDWRDQVVYFLMIDRFNDGDSSNNDQGKGEYNPLHESHYSGGDIVGITQKLDYIQNLGATAIWVTPPVANQWWSRDSEYSGYHGYWARHFKKVDEHYGSLGDYKDLSSALHDRGMYLIQDIVLNHSGIFFGYEGEYDPSDTSKNFTLYESGHQSAPEMSPFHMVDRNNPEHAAANIYNWTPGASSYTNAEQQFTYQLGNLSDINTKNPDVLAAFKGAYRYWISEVGVDAYRIDTAKYVEHEFWQQFLHDSDGIYAHAASLGKSHFLTFGEVFESSAPFSDNGEQVVTSFLGTGDKPELNSVIGFPLYFEINRVLGEGQPPAQLAYRLNKFMTEYPDPYVTPNFIDNHDTKRFLSAANEAALKQALAVIFTIPGIPVIYQGTEQGLQETRQAMFAGGFGSEESQFDEEAELYKYLQTLTSLRRNQRIFTRGDLTVLQASQAGPGLLAYKRTFEGKTSLVLMNTADHRLLVNDLDTGLSGRHDLTSLYQSDVFAIPSTDNKGGLSLVLPSRAIALVEAMASKENDSAPSTEFITWQNEFDNLVTTSDLLLSGSVSQPNTELLLVTNGNLDTAQSFQADSKGKWAYSFPVRNLGETNYQIEVYAPDLGVISTQQSFKAVVNKPTHVAEVQDPANDAKGMSQNYRPPEQPASQGQMEILSATAAAAGANLQITFTMSHLSDDWAPANGFDNVSFSLFFDLPKKVGNKQLPLINSNMIDGLNWDIAHVVYGWGNYMYRASGASSDISGEKIGVAPRIDVDKDRRTITFNYMGEGIGILDWQGVTIYATTWDISGEGYYRDVTSEGGEWVFSGPSKNAPKILDDIVLRPAKLRPDSNQ